MSRRKRLRGTCRHVDHDFGSGCADNDQRLPFHRSMGAGTVTLALKPTAKQLVALGRDPKVAVGCALHAGLGPFEVKRIDGTVGGESLAHIKRKPSSGSSSACQNWAYVQSVTSKSMWVSSRRFMSVTNASFAPDERARSVRNTSRSEPVAIQRSRPSFIAGDRRSRASCQKPEMVPSDATSQWLGPVGGTAIPTIGWFVAPDVP